MTTNEVATYIAGPIMRQVSRLIFAFSAGYAASGSLRISAASTALMAILNYFQT